MLLGEEGKATWADALKVLGGAALGLIPVFWTYLQKKRETEPEIADKKQAVRAKNQKLEDAMREALFVKFQGMISGLETKVDKLERDYNKSQQDHSQCREENAQLKERCENLRCDVERLTDRVSELEAQAGGV